MSDGHSAPIARSPLHHLGLDTRAKAAPVSATVRASEIVDLGFVSLRGPSSDAAFVGAASEALRLPLPIIPCQAVSAGHNTAMWISPDEWIITVPRASVAAQIADLNRSLAGKRHQVADNSGGYTLIRLVGNNASRVLSHCTVYDVARLTPNRVVGTAFGKVSVYLLSLESGMVVLVRRSFAEYVWRFLERAAIPYGFAVATAETNV